MNAVFTKKLTDIYATAMDYRPDAAVTQDFFATVQNRLHFAVHGHTAAEVIVARADSEKEHMGLTSWKNAPNKLDTPVYTACCSDLMSDVLAFVNEKTVLITGLTNPHVLRTADMLDLKVPGVCPGQGAHGRYSGRRGGAGPGGDDHQGNGLYRLRPAV